ncbi:hypothetical protein GQ53DRAFT_458449 [Thozetella sp. PMI_491]|nr:hypothetical protein GQ53DRAFT_458449 [Thozetella sp. PMI_491]
MRIQGSAKGSGEGWRSRKNRKRVGLRLAGTKAQVSTLLSLLFLFFVGSGRVKRCELGKVWPVFGKVQERRRERCAGRTHDLLFLPAQWSWPARGSVWPTGQVPSTHSHSLSRPAAVQVPGNRKSPVSARRNNQRSSRANPLLEPSFLPNCCDQGRFLQFSVVASRGLKPVGPSWIYPPCRPEGNSVGEGRVPGRRVVFFLAL